MGHICLAAHNAVANTYIYPLSEISDIQCTISEFAKSEQKYPVKITLAYAH
jgi:hypothetical protein